MEIYIPNNLAKGTLNAESSVEERFSSAFRLEPRSPAVNPQKLPVRLPGYRGYRCRETIGNVGFRVYRVCVWRIQSSGFRVLLRGSTKLMYTFLANMSEMRI